MISRSFLKSSLVFTIAGALPMVASLVLLPFYTNNLNDLHYLQILFYISTSLLFQILFSFSIDAYFGIKYTQLSDTPLLQKKLIGTVSALLLLIAVGLIALSSVFGNTLFDAVYEKDLQMEFWPYGFYSVLTGFFSAYFKAASICLIYLKKSKLFLISNVVNFIATIGISLGGLYLFPDTIIGPMYGRLLSGLAMFLIGHYIFIKDGEFTLEKSFLGDLVKFCTPYLVFVICGWILTQIDRYFLQSYIIKADLNAYDLILKCFFGIEFIQNSLASVIYPKIFEIWNKNKINATTPESNRYFNVFTAINIFLLILFCIIIPFIYKLIIKNPAFYQSDGYIGILAAGFGLRIIVIFYLSTILFAKRIDVLLKIFGVSAIVQIIVTLPAVKYFGLPGAIYAGILMKILQVFFCMLFTKSTFEYKYNYFKILIIPLIYLAVNIAQFILFPEYNIWIYILQLLVFCVIFYAVFKNEIKKVLVSFKLIPDSN